MQFRLIFDGKALDNHEFNPKELSIALIAIDDLLQEANRVVNDKKASKLEVKVKGSFESGSFAINFGLSFIDQLKHVANLFGQDYNPTKELWEVVFGGTHVAEGLSLCGLVGLIKWLKGLRPTKIHENSDGTYKVYKSDKYIKVEKKVYKLYQNYKIRMAFDQLTSPVRDNNGIESVAIQKKDKPQDFDIIATKENVSYFKCPEPELNKVDEPVVYDTRLNIINLSFKEGNKWYVNDGESSFYAIVEDESFLEEINNNKIAFSKGDLLKVEIRRQQFYDMTSQKLKSEYYIQEVKSHDKPQDLFTPLN